MRNKILNISIILLLSTITLFGDLLKDAKSCYTISKPYPTYDGNISQVEYTKKYRDINIAEFWISKLEHPDQVIMSPDQIEDLNAKALGVTQSLFPPQYFNATYSGSWLKIKLIKLNTFLSMNAFYTEDGKAIKSGTLQMIQSNIDIGVIKDTITTRYALVVNYANHRISPTNQTFLKSPDQKYFDRNQNAALDIGTPLAILHQSADKNWYFALSPSSYGWIKATDVALTSRKEMLDYSQSKKFIITTSSKNALWLDGKYDDYVRMGVRLPYTKIDGDYADVLIPKRGSDGSLELNEEKIKLSDVHIGYLDYTARVIITQAFKFLNAPYGWGGMFGEQDCSKFLQEIYATVGITLPRNSKQQIRSGNHIITFQGTAKERIAKLKHQGAPAATLIHLPGHIMLYLGDYEGEPYMIHTLWGASQSQNPIAKTVVTPLQFKDYVYEMDSATILKP